MTSPPKSPKPNNKQLMTLAPTPRALRLRAVNGSSQQPGRFVLYWMLAQRRTHYNFALERAAQWAEHLGLPLLILESVTLVYELASPRQHVFLLQGMLDNQQRLAGRGVTYYPFIERIPGERGDLLRALSEQAAFVVTDDYPMAMHQGLIAEAGREFSCKVDAVGSCGLLSLRWA